MQLLVLKTSIGQIVPSGSYGVDMLPWVVKGIFGTALDHYRCKTNAVGVNDLIGTGFGHRV